MTPRPLVRLRGSMLELTTSPTFAFAEESFVSAVVTDPACPVGAMATLQRRFPYAVELSWQPEGGLLDLGGTYSSRVAAATDLEVVQSFVRHVRNSDVGDASSRRCARLSTGRPPAGRGLMRPHLLEINAFGPFAGTVSVDLDDLGDGGLLLLHGETGAGKTSVLDALGYALYGDVPGDRGIRGLRSEHAGAVDETWVRLTFSAGGRRLRIRRSPEQSLPKQRATGVTTRRASVLLEELGPEGASRRLATRLDEAGLMVGDLVGMSAAQFFQVVLLPQGRFAAFLQAPAAQRQALLQQLFGTERFSDVEAALKRRRDDLRAELDAVSARP